MFDTVLSPETLALRLGAAMGLAGIVGLEREWRSKPAGLRTHMLVGLGAATFYLVAHMLVLGPLNEAEDLRIDPLRIFEGVITGIGFLGAGAIIQGSGDVKGLTTGAGIWVAGAIGLACGAGQIVLAAAVTVLTLVILAVAGFLEHRFMK
jgi:putative Mg2+ transporter-C (MgtC) family protein